MKSKHSALKHASIGIIAAGLLIVSGQLAADDASHLVWAGRRVPVSGQCRPTFT
jgi:hypothetical protein